MKIKYLLYSVLTTAVLSGCIDVLDKKDLSAITEKDVWNNSHARSVGALSPVRPVMCG